MINSESNDKIQNHPFWALPIQKVVEILDTNTRNGLSESEAERRIKFFGPNVIEKPRTFSGFFILLNQFKSPLILILLFAGIVTLFIAHYRDAFFIFAAVIANAVLGFYQEYKAEKALAELKTYLRQRARVIRDGIEREIDAAELVPGDIVHLAQGDRIPADGRLVLMICRLMRRFLPENLCPYQNQLSR